MQHWAITALFCALPLGSAAAEPEWLRLESANFHILSRVSARETRAVAENLDLARAVFAGILGVAPPRSEPVQVVIFRSAKEYEPYRALDASVAQYSRNSGLDYIVIANDSDGVLHSALHELFHANLQRAGWTLPLWLEEGLAEVYSTLRASGGKLYVGAAIPSRRTPLETAAYPPLAEMLAATPTSPEYARKDRRRAFYSGSWALTHMLLFHPEYAPEFPGVLEQLRGEPFSRRVLERAYAKPLKTIETDLANYARIGRFREKEFDAPTGGLSSGSERTVEPAPAFDVALTMADLNNRAGAGLSVRTALEKIAAANPNRPEPWVSLGYFEMSHGQTDQADNFFSRAFDLGSRNPVMLREHAGIAAPTNPAEAERSLKRLIEIRPGEQAALLLLAEVQNQTRQFRAAIETLSAYARVRGPDDGTAESALRFARATAIAKSEIDDRVSARVAALRWYGLAQGIEERDRADRVLKYLASLDAIDRNARASLVQTGEQKVEVLDARPAPVVRPSVSGQLIALDCNREPSRLVLQIPQGTSAFLIDDFEKLTVYGFPAQAFEIKCGPQKPVDVRIQYDPPPAGQRGIVGLARAIHFEPEIELIH